MSLSRNSKLVVGVLLSGALAASLLTGKYLSLPNNDYGYNRTTFLMFSIPVVADCIGALICLGVGMWLFGATRRSRLNSVLACAVYVALVIGLVVLNAPASKAIAALLGHGEAFSGERDLALIRGVVFMIPIAGFATVIFILSICWLSLSSRRKTADMAKARPIQCQDDIAQGGKEE